MWREVSLIGRDKLLNLEIYPRARGKKAPFLIVGPLGVGLSAIMQWAYENATGPKALVSATWTVREILIEICLSWGISLSRDGEDGKKLRPERATISVLAKEIMQQERGMLFVEDIHKSSPALLRRLKVWRERFTVFVAGVPPFNKEDVKRILWGLKEVAVEPLNESDRLKLAERVCIAVGSDKSPLEIAQASRGTSGQDCKHGPRRN